MGNARNIAFWVALFLLILALFNLFSSGQSALASQTASYSDFMRAVEAGEVEQVTIDGEKVMFTVGTQDFVTILPGASQTTDSLT